MLFFLIYTVFCTVSSCSATAVGYNPDESRFNTSVLYSNLNLLGFNPQPFGVGNSLRERWTTVLYFFLSGLVFAHLGGVRIASGWMASGFGR